MNWGKEIIRKYLLDSFTITSKTSKIHFRFPNGIEWRRGKRVGRSFRLCFGIRMSEWMNEWSVFDRVSHGNGVSRVFDCFVYVVDRVESCKDSFSVSSFIFNKMHIRFKDKRGISLVCDAWKDIFVRIRWIFVLFIDFWKNVSNLWFVLSCFEALNLLSSSNGITNGFEDIHVRCYSIDSHRPISSHRS